MNTSPTECTLDKMKSIDTWLFELNKFAYFDTGANKSPLMNCQKVVARDPNTNKMVTARFCQLNTGDSDACAILQAKLRSSSEDKTQTMQNTNNNNYNNNGRRGGKQTAADVEEQFHCSICTTDSCNGVTSFKHRVSLTSKCPQMHKDSKASSNVNISCTILRYYADYISYKDLI
uniref:Protein quiver n=1 Tax=Glossina pallidipes TaxID=7398 RepID=A0A1A9ZDB7_GLOPL